MLSFGQHIPARFPTSQKFPPKIFFSNFPLLDFFLPVREDSSALDFKAIRGMPSAAARAYDHP
jgi:hypothetical protein